MNNKLHIICLSFLLCVMLIAASVCSTGCESGKAPSPSDPTTAAEEAAVQVTTMGEGTHNFTLIVADADGSESTFLIHTDKTTVGEALTDLGLIEGEQGEFGLYIKTVNSIRADYDLDGVYWAFYINGEYAVSGADTTQITDGAEYAFRVEK